MCVCVLGWRRRLMLIRSRSGGQAFTHPPHLARPISIELKVVLIRWSNLSRKLLPPTNESVNLLAGRRFAASFTWAMSWRTIVTGIARRSIAKAFGRMFQSSRTTRRDRRR